MTYKAATRVIVRMVPVLVVTVVLLLAVMPALRNGSGALAADPSMPESRGRIDRIDYSGEVVIDDALFRLNSLTRYYSSQGRDILSTKFVKGDIVAYSLVPNSTIVLTLWKTE